MNKDTSEITKLTERISKDPKSKLFVPLAEEYKKIGDIEMAILVLTDGLKNNPGYVTARSFLGRLLLEQGDLAGAQKEFEEVVKAIPDNLLAQRKLGDIYVYEGKGKQALAQYRTALTLNPKDTEVASLVTDIEAGRDVTGRLPKLKPPPPPPPPPPPEPQAASAAAAPAMKDPLKTAMGKKRTEPAHPLGATGRAAEEPEEVLVVEPLEPESGAGVRVNSEQDLHAAGLDFLAEPIQDSMPPAAVEPAAQDFGTEGPLQFQPQQAQGTTEEELALSQGEAVPEAPESDIPGGLEKKADDFTTDTLAELYIGQGFYEKAIDIYERMLADNPASRKLREKLDQVRAMAGAATPAEEPHGSAVPTAVPDGSAVWAGEEVPAPEGLESGFGEFVPPSAPDFSAPAPAGAGFKPVEYAPRAAEVEKSAGKETTPSVPRASGTRRKETVDRLESWLKNIVKEK